MRLNIFPLTIIAIFFFAASAAAQCSFTTAGTTMYLNSDCNTDHTIEVPEGMTLDFNNNTITAVDPAGGHFLGAVVGNAPGATEIHILNPSITTLELANVCDPGGTPDNRLRGILFNGAGGSITGGSVMNINQGASGCQEGNAIEVRQFPFDGSETGNRKFVSIKNVDVVNWQKTGIVANGDVEVEITNCKIGSSATQTNLAANSIQFGFGAIGKAERNKIAQNTWQGGSDYAATAILIYSANPGVIISQNVMMEGNADVGIYVIADGVTVENNKVFETGDDGLYDIGIGNYGNGNYVSNNKIKGYDTPTEYVVGTDAEGRRNKVIPSKQ